MCRKDGAQFSIHIYQNSSSGERSTETEEDTTKQELGAALLPDAKRLTPDWKRETQKEKLKCAN
jgi:hypothetical protein